MLNPIGLLFGIVCNLQILTIYLCVSTFFVKISKIITILVSNYIVAPGLCLVIMCILISFGVSNIITVKLHDIINFS